MWLKLLVQGCVGFSGGSKVRIRDTWQSRQRCPVCFIQRLCTFTVSIFILRNKSSRSHEQFHNVCLHPASQFCLFMRSWMVVLRLSQSRTQTRRYVSQQSGSVHFLREMCVGVTHKRIHRQNVNMEAKTETLTPPCAQLPAQSLTNALSVRWSIKSSWMLEWKCLEKSDAWWEEL